MHVLEYLVIKIDIERRINRKVCCENFKKSSIHFVSNRGIVIIQHGTSKDRTRANTSTLVQARENKCGIPKAPELQNTPILNIYS